MKLLFTLVLAYFFQSALFAQQTNNLIVFSQEGERFQLVIDGERVNSDYQTNVKVRQLIQPSAIVKILFEDSNIPELDKRIFFDPEQGMERVFVLKRNRKGDMKMRLSSQVPILQAAPVRNNQFVFDWGVPQTPAAPATVTETRTTTTTVQSGGGNPNGAGVGVTLSDGNGGTISAGVRINGGNTTGSFSETMTTTTSSSVTTTTSSSGTAPVRAGGNAPGVPVGTPNCPSMSPNNFNAALQSISGADFDDTRLQTAKQMAASNCLTAAQAARVAQTFEFEENRLEFAKFAYDRCLDPQNYFLLNDTFEFDGSVNELQNYMQGR